MQFLLRKHSSMTIRKVRFQWGAVPLLLLLHGCAVETVSVDSTQAALEEAKLLIRVSDFKAAYELLERNPLSDEDVPEIQAQWYFLSGISAWHRVPPSAQWQAKAREHLEVLVERFPESVLASQGAYTLGRILEVRDFPEDVVDPEAAALWYKRCIEEWPEYVSAAMSRFRLAAMDMNAYEDPERMARGVAALDLWLQQNREHELAPVAAVLLANQLDIQLNDPESALPYYLLAEELGWVSKTLIGHRRWRIAEIAESLDQVDLAVEMYQKIIRENLQSARGYESQMRLKALKIQHPERSIEIPPLLPIKMEEDA